MAKQNKKQEEVKPIVEETIMDNTQTSTESNTSTKDNVEEVTEEITHVITNEDLENNPELVDNGVEVGDIVSFSKEDEVTPEEMEQLFRAAVIDFVEATQGVYLGGRAAECRKRLLTFL